MFAYCSNNPVMFEDTTGEFFTATLIVIGAGFLVGTAMGAYMAACTGGSTSEIIEAAIEGGLTGAASAAIGLFMPTVSSAFVAGTAAGAAIDFVVQSVSHLAQNGSTDGFDLDEDRFVENALLTGFSSTIHTFDGSTTNIPAAIDSAILNTEVSTCVSTVVIGVKNNTGTNSNRTQNRRPYNRAKSVEMKRLLW